jgi:hypothetical protein
VRIAVERWYFVVPTSSVIARGLEKEKKDFTCNAVSTSVRGAGLTSVMSCAAADVICSPADCMAGCMRGASDARLKVDSGEGKLSELAVMAASICSTDDCIMLARLFNSVKASLGALRD